MGSTGEQGRWRPAELMAALSFATDLSTGQPMEAGQRSALVAVALGRELGVPRDELRDAYYLSMLITVGCSGDAHDMGALWGDELEASSWMGRIDAGKPIEFLTELFRHAPKGR